MNKIDTIENLAYAFEKLGLKTDIDYNSEWRSECGKVHRGITLSTDFYPDGEQLEFLFTPTGKLIANCCDAPVK